MNPETIQTITTWLGLIVNFLSIVAGVGLFAVAIYQSLKSRAVRWDALIFAGFLLWIFPYGIRNYAPVLTDATIDLFNSMAGKREPMEEAIKAFIGNVNEELPIVPDVPTVVVATPQFTATPFPTPSVNFAATATVFFENNLPTPTPPMSLQDFEATATKIAEGNPTPSPTPCVATQVGDVARGCIPATPIPGS